MMRNNAREMIRSVLANQQTQEETQPSTAPAATPDGVARQIDFTQAVQANNGTHQQSGTVVHLNVNGMHWPPLAGARGGNAQSYRDPFFSEPLYQQAYGLHQVLDNRTNLMIKDRKELGAVTQQIKTNALSHNTVYEASMINIIITFH
jgi:hypothetical protein